MKNKVNKFLLNALENKEMNLIDIYFSKLFDFNNNFSCVYILFSSLISLSNRKGHVCLFLNEILNKNFFSNYIIDFLYFFFNNYLSLNKCINLMINNNIISIWYNKIYTPLVLYNNSIYLYKFWYYENYVVNYLNKNIFIKLNKNICLLKLNYYIKIFNINKYFKNIILNILFNKITIISGFPGTGKSIFIIKLVIILYKIFNFNFRNDIVILSTTGKSSVWLTKYLNNILNELNISDNFKKKLPNKCYTIHKFLGFNYKNNYINFNKYNKIITNYLIIDESSMVDLINMFNILSSLNDYTKIIFVGDNNQIGSIEPGSIFNEIGNFIYKKCKLNNYYNYFLYYKDIFYLLKKNYRYKKNKNLSLFLNLIKNKNFNKLDKFLLNKNFSSNINFYDSNKFNYKFFLNLCINKYFNYINFIRKKFNKKNLLYFFNKNQIICLLKNTKYGIFFINNFINRYLIKNNLIKNIYFNNEINNYCGEPILFTKNNYDLKLFNGDLGFFVLNKDNKLRIIFNDFKNYFHPYVLNNTWINSWAITVYKSQGSEYDNVLFVLPNDFSYLLNNNIIYTAISRAKKNIIIYGKIDILIKSIETDNLKFNNIINRLKIF